MTAPSPDPLHKVSIIPRGIGALGYTIQRPKEALHAVLKGGVVVCVGIHMSDIPAFEYTLLWGERSIRFVANLTQEDGEAFFAAIDPHPVMTHAEPFALVQANVAIKALRSDRVAGAAVLVP